MTVGGFSVDRFACCILKVLALVARMALPSRLLSSGILDETHFPGAHKSAFIRSDVPRKTPFPSRQISHRPHTDTRARRTVRHQTWLPVYDMTKGKREKAYDALRSEFDAFKREAIARPFRGARKIADKKAPSARPLVWVGRRGLVGSSVQVVGVGGFSGGGFRDRFDRLLNVWRPRRD